MRLSAIPLINYQNVNSFCTANQWQIRALEINTLYFQLIDLDNSCGMNSCPMRYIAGVGSSNQPASMIVTFPSIDCTQTIRATATQDPNDGSIWSVTLSSVQRPYGGSVQFALTQGNNTNYFSVLNMLCVENPRNCGSDGGLQDSGTFVY
jgi:hypothetical protein